ncbi:PPOX class F420-dependent oxidoreductase [Nitrosopumilus ureiphilus]|uniref:PPOX class F420-dependent oxidoreductase n=1 Tax=Nitrosopumilus ureiphilus TaxID=1470067 RepID=A0A7D5M4J4_9ARCH|nr:PPOX class F420-dependent oxidoreductase [Nitrosopumilus ureiphilus]QLH07054.1 PPOX class F420-dependent oxidoreductase [Nitrosopumilus ureiphilus]
MFSLDEIKSEKYISLETYRKNDQPVQTPVWFVVKDDLLYVVTRSQTGKVKRLQNNLKVKFALCTIKGKVTGEWISGTAKILTDKETEEAVKMRDQKYGFMAKIAKFLSKSKGEFFAFSIKID